MLKIDIMASLKIINKYSLIKIKYLENNLV